MPRDLLVNIVAFNINWFACIGLAAAGRPLLATLVVIPLVVIQLLMRRSRIGRETRLLVEAAVLGFVADSVLVLGGVIGFPAEAQFGAPTTLWMVALWVNFATLMTVGFRWLDGRWWLAALFGGLGAPWSYVGGSALGAATLPAGFWPAVAGVGVMWALAMPWLVWRTQRIMSNSMRTPGVEVTA